MDGMEPNDGAMDQGPQGGYCIEIYVGADGKPMSVNVEAMDEEMGEEQHGGPAGMPDMTKTEDKGVPVKSMEEALAMVQQIVQNQGGKPGGGKPPPPPHDPEQEHAELMEGYGKGSYAAQQQGMPIDRVFKGRM